MINIIHIFEKKYKNTKNSIVRPEVHKLLQERLDMNPTHIGQKGVSNHTIQSLLPSRLIQAKFEISKPEDEFEKEADRLADCVTNPSESNDCIRKRLSQSSNGLDNPKINKKKTDGSVDARKDEIAEFIAKRDFDSEIQGLTSHGDSLPEDVSDFFEYRFMKDFSNVRIHIDDVAAESAEKLNAKAFTIGSHIAFGKGHYDPFATSGRRLIAHELAHVVQQNSPSFLALQKGSDAKKDASSSSDAQDTKSKEESGTPIEIMSRAIGAKNSKDILKMLNDKKEMKENYKAFFTILNGYSMFDIIKIISVVGSSLVQEHIGLAIGIANRPRLLAAIKLVQFSGNKDDIEGLSSYVSILPNDQQEACKNFLKSRNISEEMINEITSPKELIAARNEFRANNKDLGKTSRKGEDIVSNIEAAIAAAFPNNHRMQIAFLKKYSTDKKSLKVAQNLKGTREGDTSGSTSKIRIDIFEKSAEHLGGILFHEMTHLKHGKGFNADWQEGEGYAIDQFVASESGNEDREQFIQDLGVTCTRRKFTRPSPSGEDEATECVNLDQSQAFTSTNPSRARHAYIVSYVAMKLLQLAIDGKFPYGNPLAIPKLSREGYQDLMADYVGKEKSDRSAQLQALLGWIRNQLSSVKDLSNLAFAPLLPEYFSNKSQWDIPEGDKEESG